MFSTVRLCAILVIFIHFYPLRLYSNPIPPLSKRIPVHLQKASQSLVRIISNDNHSNGVLISKDGLILTASHGLTDSSLTIITHTGTIYKATTYYRNPSFDLAVLKIPTLKPLPYIEIGSINQCGETVILLGKQFYEPLPSAHYGKVLMKGINLLSSDLTWTSETLQPNIYNGIIHTAHCVKGYSGSPLLSSNGKLIGINIAYGQKGNKSLTFSVQIDTYSRFLGTLTHNGISTISSPQKNSSTFTENMSVEERVDWILEGLEKHSYASGKKSERVTELSQKVRSEALGKYKHGILNLRTVTQWVWKEYLLNI